MKSIFTSLLLLLLSQSLIAQSAIKIGEKAPAINITHWVKNVPSDKTFEGKNIVLEFWATWCGPCIAAVPHMNELQNKAKDDNLVFVSITDESVAKINRTIDRIPFQSIVVTDTTKQTQIQFGDGKEGLEAYPLTILIDDQHIVRWIDEPMQLTENVLNQFLKGTLDAPKKKTIEKEKKNTEVTEVKKFTPTQTFFKLVQNKNIPFIFELRKSTTNDPGIMKLGDKAFLIRSSNTKALFKELFNDDVLIVDSLNQIKYDLTYKNLRADNDSKKRLRRELLAQLNLSEVTKEVTFKENELSIKDGKKLKKALDESFTAKSDAGDKIIFTAYTLKSLAEALTEELDGIQFDYNSKDEKKYDFIIEIDSEDRVLASLQSYGLQVKEVTKTKMQTLLKAKG